jgi:hypothetical protein
MSDDERHFLVVPVAPDAAMILEHPASCPQHGHTDTVRRMDGSYACPFTEEEHQIGLEASFRHAAFDTPMFLDAPIVVRPGRYPIEFGLRLAYQPGTAA